MSDLETVPESAAPQPAPNRETDLAKITDLIAGDSPENSEQESAPEVEQPDPDPVDLETVPPEPEPETPADDAPAIDYELLVPMPDGAESVTLGQLKDHYQQHSDFQSERDQWEAHRMQQDNEQMAVRKQLSDLAQLLGDVNPEALQYVQEQRRLNQAGEAQKLLQIFPEWADPAVKAKARGPLVETMKHYSFTEADFAHIDDSRMIKALHDLTRLRAKEAAGIAAREQIKADLPKGQKPVQRKQTAAQKQRDAIERAKTGSEDDKLQAIGALIDGA